jgi:hypothetical protein
MACRRPKPDRRRALESIYALVIGSLMVPAVPLALMADSALAAEPQIPEDFQGTWCTERGTLTDTFAEGAYGGGPDCGNFNSFEVTATGVKSPALSASCTVRKVARCLPLGDDFSKPGAGAGSKVVSDKPVGTRLSHRAPMHWQLQTVGDDRDRLGDRKGIHACGHAARLSVSVG